MPQKVVQTIAELPPTEVEKVRQWVNENYHLSIGKQNGEYFGCIERRHDTPSGCERWILWASFNQKHATSQKAVEAMNEQLKVLSFTPFYAELAGIPPDALSLIRPLPVKVAEQLHEIPSLEHVNDGI